MAHVTICGAGLRAGLFAVGIALAAVPVAADELPSPASDPNVAELPAPERLMDADDLIGRTVLGAVEGRIGTVVDVASDAVGAGPGALIVALDARFATGGRGGEEVAIPLDAGRLRLGDDRGQGWVAVSDLTEAQVRALPRVAPLDEAVSVTGEPQR